MIIVNSKSRFHIFLVDLDFKYSVMNPKSMSVCRRIFKNKLFLTRSRCSINGNINGVQIPAKIERKPTDILKELSNTVSLKSINISYRAQYGIIWHNLSCIGLKLAGMSVESGRKAAKWIVSQNPELFQHKISEPYIEAFAPPKVLNEKTEISEEALINAIQNIHVEHAINLYNALKEKEIDVSASTKQQLLEMVCYFNCTNKPDVSMVEKSYYIYISNKNPENTWKRNGFHMQLFDEMEHNAQSYSAVILGSFKHNDCDGGFNLFKKAEEEGIKFGIDVYNAVLLHSYNTVEHFFDRKSAILEMLNKIAKLKIKPNLETLNNVLSCTANMRKYFKSKSFTIRVLNEFRRIGIKPSLGTYYYILNILNLKNHNDPKSRFSKQTFVKILNEIENNTYEVEDEADFAFFVKAMEVACKFNLNLVKRVDELLNTGNNRIFLNKERLQRNYYRLFLNHIFHYGNLEEVSKLYTGISSKFAIDTSTYKEILWILLEREDGGPFLMILWKDIKGISARDLTKLLYLVLRVLDELGHQMSDNYDYKIAKDIWEIYEKSEDYQSLDSEGASSILKIFCRKKDKELSCEVFNFGVKLVQNSISLNFSSLMEFINLCQIYEESQKALECLEYSCQIKCKDILKLISFVESKFKLNEDHLKKLEILKTESLKIDQDDMIIL